jgi:hypothetical protein
MVVMKAAGRAVAMRVRAWRAVRHESAAGVNGSPYVMLSQIYTHGSMIQEENIPICRKGSLYQLDPHATVILCHSSLLPRYIYCMYVSLFYSLVTSLTQTVSDVLLSFFNCK